MGSEALALTAGLYRVGVVFSPPQVVPGAPPGREKRGGLAVGMGMWVLALTNRDGLYRVPKEMGVSPVVGAEDTWATR